MKINFTYPKKYSFFLFAILTLVFHLLLQGNLIKDDPILRWDDQQLLRPLWQISSLKDYSLSSTLDVQPVRDMSYLIDIFIKNHFSLSPFHLTNVLLWVVIGLLVFSIFLQLEIPLTHAFILALLFSFHPIFVNATSWIAARKHLLATTFILGATAYLITLIKLIKKTSTSVLNIKTSLILLFLYSLSILSQPITLLWPLWALIFLIYNHQHNQSPPWKKIFLFLTPLLVMMVGVALLNRQFYLGPEARYHALTGAGDKTIAYQAENWFHPFLSLGRYTFNLLIPFDLSHEYNHDHFNNFIGLILFFLCLFGLIKQAQLSKHQKQEKIIWGSFFFLHLFLVTFNMTHIFASDTYLLTSSLAFFFLLYKLVMGVYLAKIPSRTLQPILYSTLLLTLILFPWLSYQQIQTWKSEYHLFKNAYEKWPSFQSIYKYLLVLSAQDDQDLNLPLIQSLIVELSETKNPETFWAVKKFSDQFYMRIYENKLMKIPEKLQKISQFNFESQLKYYFLAELFTDLKRPSEAVAMAKKSYALYEKTQDKKINLERLQFLLKSHSLLKTE